MLLCAFSQTLFWSAPAHQYLITHVRHRRSGCLPDHFSGASGERRPLLCTANPCASPLHQQVTEVSKSQGVRSCSAYNIASSALGQTPLHAPNALYKTGSRLQFRPRAPQNSPGGRVRLASCILHSPEMIPEPNKFWFGSRTVEQPQLQDAAAALQYIYILLLLKILNNNEFTIDNGYAAVETHSKSSIIKLLSKLYELVLLQTVKSYKHAAS